MINKTYATKTNTKTIISGTPIPNKMLLLFVLLIGSVKSGEFEVEFELPEVPSESAALPKEEIQPTPLPGQLYPRESESREVNEISI